MIKISPPLMLLITKGLVLLLIGLFLSACGSPSSELLHPNDLQPRNKAADVNVNMGVEYMRRGQLKVALKKLHKALQLEPDNVLAHNAIAVLYERLQQTEQAKIHYKLALKYNPSDPSSNNNYGNFMCRTQGIEQAEPYFLKALAHPLYKTPELAYTNAGMCAMRAKQYQKSHKYFEQALQSSPRFVKAVYQMAELKQQQGDSQTANRYLERYLTMAKQNAESLWLGIRIAHTLQQRDREASYRLLLRNGYPDSKQTQLLYQSGLENN